MNQLLEVLELLIDTTAGTVHSLDTCRAFDLHTETCSRFFLDLKSMVGDKMFIRICRRITNKCENIRFEDGVRMERKETPRAILRAIIEELHPE